jgi:hypothetical protein
MSVLHSWLRSRPKYRSSCSRATAGRASCTRLYGLMRLHGPLPSELSSSSSSEWEWEGRGLGTLCQRSRHSASLHGPL